MYNVCKNVLLLYYHGKRRCSGSDALQPHEIELQMSADPRVHAAKQIYVETTEFP